MLSEKIIELTSKQFGVSVQELKSASQKRKYVEPRHVSMYLHKKHMSKTSLKTIAEMHGREDHSTVSNAIKTCQNLIDTNPEFIIQVSEIESKLKRLERKDYSKILDGRVARIFEVINMSKIGRLTETESFSIVRNILMQTDSKDYLNLNAAEAVTGAESEAIPITSK